MKQHTDTGFGHRSCAVILLLFAVIGSFPASGSELPAILTSGFEVKTLPNNGQELLTDIEVINVQEIDRRAVDQGIDEITLGFDMQNNGVTARNLSVFASTSDPAATVASGSVPVDSVPGFTTLAPAGIVQLRQDRSSSLDIGALSFFVLGERAPPPEVSEPLSSGRGGRLSLTTRDGAVVTFEVPPDGLPDGGSVITITEAGSLPALPQDFDPVVALSLKPGGQTFTRSNRMIIEVPESTREPGEILVAFMAEEDGSALRFLPLVNGDPVSAMSSGQRLEFELPHFSTTGIGKSRSVCSNLPPPGSSAEDRNAHRIQQAACAAATQQINGDENAQVDTNVVFDALDDWLENPQDGVRKRIEDAIDEEPPLDLDGAFTLAREALRLAAIAQLYVENSTYFTEVGDLVLRLLEDIRAGIIAECANTGFTLDKIGDLAKIAASIQVLTVSEETNLTDFTCPDALAIAPVEAPVVTLGDTVTFEVLTSEDVVASLVADDLVRTDPVDARDLVASSPGLTNIRGTVDGRILAEATEIGLVPIEVTINVPVQGGGSVPRNTSGEVRVLPDFEGEYTVTIGTETFRGIGGLGGEGLPPPRPICEAPFDYRDRVGSRLTISDLEFVPESDFSFVSGETYYGALGTATLEGVEWPLTVGLFIFESGRDDRPPGAEGSPPRVFLDGAVNGIELTIGSGPSSALDSGNAGTIVGSLPLERSRTLAYSDNCGSYFDFFGFRANATAEGRLQSDGSNISAPIVYRFRGREFTPSNVRDGQPNCRFPIPYGCTVDGSMTISRPLEASPP